MPSGYLGARLPSTFLVGNAGSRDRPRAEGEISRTFRTGSNLFLACACSGDTMPIEARPARYATGVSFVGRGLGPLSSMSPTTSTNLLGETTIPLERARGRTHKRVYRFFE